MTLNEHEWMLSYGGLESGACSHGELSEDRNKNWIVRGSAAHAALAKIVLDKRRLNKIPYWLNFRYVYIYPTIKCAQLSFVLLI